jgi:hypothetical protein
MPSPPIIFPPLPVNVPGNVVPATAVSGVYGNSFIPAQEIAPLITGTGAPLEPPSRSEAIFIPSNAFQATSPQANPIPAFSPSVLSNLVLWVRADEGVTSAAGHVTVWADQSENHFDLNVQQNGGPVFVPAGGPNNQPYLTFADQGISREAALITGADAKRTMFIVSRTPGPTQNLTQDDSFDYFINANRNIFVQGIAFEIDGAAVPIFEQVCLVNHGNGGNPSNQEFYVGGTLTTIVPNNLSPNPPSAFFNVGFRLGAFAYIGDVAEVIVYNKDLSSAEIAQVTAYLRVRYGV